MLLVHPQASLLRNGSAAPAITLQTDTGVHVDALAAAAHRPLLIQFFSTVCDTCARQGPALCALPARFRRTLVIAVDAAGETAAAIRAYGLHAMPPPCVAHRLVDPALSVTRAYQAAVVPTVYVVDSSGRIAYGGVGGNAIDGAQAALMQLGG